MSLIVNRGGWSGRPRGSAKIIRNTSRVPIAGSGRDEGDAAAMCRASSERVQLFQVYIGMCGGREDEVNSSGLEEALALVGRGEGWK